MTSHSTSRPDGRSPIHFTTRRGFIAAMGFSGTSLYGLWAGLGAAPGPLDLFGRTAESEREPAAGHGGHGSAAEGPTVDEFRRLTAEFIARYTTPEGAVHPRLGPPATGPSHAPDPNPHDAEAGTAPHGPAGGQGMAAGAAPDGHGSHAGSSPEASGTAQPMHATAAAHHDLLEVYLLAEKWYYEPLHLRLDAGVPYRFRIMASDISHGASMQLGTGSRLLRLRPGRLVEVDMTFTSPGSYLVYCSLYCGEGHDLMQGRIEVVS